jgi:hypothetical protein
MKRCETLASQDLVVDAKSAASLQQSLNALKGHPDANMIDIIQLLATKPMQVLLL